MPYQISQERSSISAGQVPAAAAVGDPSIAVGDVVNLLQLLATLGSARVDQRTWHQKLLNGIMQLLEASSAAALILKDVDGGQFTVVSLFDQGFQTNERRHTFRREFQTKPLQDPLSRLAWDRYISLCLDTFTSLRNDLVDDNVWNDDTHVLKYRKPTGTGDCVLSLHRGTNGYTHALYAFRPIVDEATDGGMPSGMDLKAATRFRPRERLLLDTLHRGLERLYHVEANAYLLGRAGELSPRLRQALDHLLGGNSERDAATKMCISIHTFHDYVKMLYARFGVSSRSELLSRWIETTGDVTPSNTA